MGSSVDERMEDRLRIALEKAAGNTAITPDTSNQDLVDAVHDMAEEEGISFREAKKIAIKRRMLSK